MTFTVLVCASGSLFLASGCCCFCAGLRLEWKMLKLILFLLMERDLLLLMTDALILQLFSSDFIQVFVS